VQVTGLVACRRRTEAAQHGSDPSAERAEPDHRCDHDRDRTRYPATPLPGCLCGAHAATIAAPTTAHMTNHASAISASHVAERRWAAAGAA
jgi:hypothetical protein